MTDARHLQGQRQQDIVRNTREDRRRRDHQDKHEEDSPSEGCNMMWTGSWLDKEGRKLRTQGLERNNCGYVAAFDLLAGALWLRRLKIKDAD